MNEAKRPRGRPRAYDRERALARATGAFWDRGYTATSLDELGAAMAMNKPSLYAAFGDKEALYLEALARYRDDSLAAMRAALDPARPLGEGLRIVFESALGLYLAGAKGARGCLLIGTAATEAVSHEAVRRVLGTSLAAFEGAFEDRFRIAVARGEIAPSSDPAVLARLASAMLHSLAVRARAGDARATLEAIAAAGLDMIDRLGR